MSLLLLALFLLLNGLQFAQVRIKERVTIKPEIKLSEKATVDYAPIAFQFGGPRPFSFIIESPSGSVSGSNAGFGAPPSVIDVPAVNGDYKVTVNGWTEGQSNVGYSVTWLDPYGNTQWIAGYEMWFWFGGTQVDSFKFSRIPEPVPFDFSILLDEHFVYGKEESVISFWYTGDVTDKSVTLTFAGSDPDIIFFDRFLQQEMGSTVTTTLDDSENFSVRYKSVNIVYPKQITVIAHSNGLQRTDSLTILQPEYVSAYFEKENLSPGDTVNVIVKRVNAKYGYESSYPDTTHFEVGINAGCGLGKILAVNGEQREHFESIRQPIRFVVTDSLGSEADSVIVLEVGAPIIAEEDVVAASIISSENIQQKNKNLMNQSMSVETEQSVNKIRKLKALDVNSCTVYNPIFENNYDDAVAAVNISGDCEKNATCKTTNPQTAPRFDIHPDKSINTICSKTPEEVNGQKKYEISGLIIQEKSIKQEEPIVCYNKTLDKWIIKVNDENTIKVNYNYYWCEDNMKSQWPNIIWYFSDLETIPTDKICKAISDLINQRFLIRQGTSYAIREVIGEHENQHALVYKLQSDSVINELDLNKKINGLSKSCSEIKNFVQYKIDVKNKIDTLINQYQKILYEKNDDIQGIEDTGYGIPDAKFVANEERAQFPAFEKVGKKYLRRLVERAKMLGLESCTTEYVKRFPGLFIYN